MNELKGYLVARDLVSPALDRLQQPDWLDEPCVQWLTPRATQEDLMSYAEAIEAAT